MRRLSETVQVESYIAGAEDSHGNEIDAWSPPVDVLIYAFNPGVTDEPPMPGHDRTVTTPTIYVPSAVILHPRDRVTVRGKRFDVDGDTLDFRNPFDASMDGNSINLKAASDGN